MVIARLPLLHNLKIKWRTIFLSCGIMQLSPPCTTTGARGGSPDHPGGQQTLGRLRELLNTLSWRKREIWTWHTNERKKSRQIWMTYFARFWLQLFHSQIFLQPKGGGVDCSASRSNALPTNPPEELLPSPGSWPTFQQEYAGYDLYELCPETI